MAGFLRDEGIIQYDVIAIQEPWKNPFMWTTHHPVRRAFDLVYPDPSHFDQGRINVCFFINRRLGKDRIQVLPPFSSHSSLCVQLRMDDNLSGTDDEAIYIRIHNIYNPPRGASMAPQQPALTLLAKALSDQGGFHENLNAPDACHIESIIVGDFNIHHPAWGGDLVNADSRSEELLAIIDEFRLFQHVPRGTKTFSGPNGRAQTLDLSFTTDGLTDRVVNCGIADHLEHGSDHWPIETIVDVTVQEVQPEPTYAWDKVSSTTFNGRLAKEAESLPPLQPTPESLDRHAHALMIAVHNTIKATVPQNHYSPYTVPGFTPECKAICERVRRARRAKQKYKRRLGDGAARTQAAKRRLKTLRHAKKSLIAKTLRQTHRDLVEGAIGDVARVWKLAKWSKNRESPFMPFSPALERPDGTMEARKAGIATMLQQKFFPTPPPADLSDLAGIDLGDDQFYPDPIDFPDLQEEELKEVIKSTAPNKAPGPDKTPNRALIIGLPTLAPLLTQLFRACIKAGHHPASFKFATTVALRKPGKGDYSQVGAYRPIALLPTIGKALETLVAKRISWATETYNLLPRGHMGAHKGVSTELALHALVEKIHAAWAKGQVCSLLCLDVAGAFDNVSHQRLLHNLRKRRIGGDTARWIRSFLQDRKSTLKLPDWQSPIFDIDTGIPQGSGLSPVLYLFYNGDLVELGNNIFLGSMGTGWVDDIAYLTVGDTAETTVGSLQNLTHQAQTWAKHHASKFDINKFQLVHFAPHGKEVPNNSLTIRLPTGDHTIEPAQKAKYLGVLMDSRLSWDYHLNHLEAKVTKKLACLSMLAGSTWGIGVADLRRLYVTTVLPQFLYCCSVWFVPTGGLGYKHREDKVISVLQRMQRRAAQIVSGAFRTTSGHALDIELNLLPVRQKLDVALNQTLLRAASSPLYGYIADPRIEIPNSPNYHTPTGMLNKEYAKLSPLQKLEYRYAAVHQGKLQELEKKVAYVVPPWWQRVPFTIAKTPEEAMKFHDAVADGSYLHFYTDGSGINDRIGASAVRTIKIPEWDQPNINLPKIIEAESRKAYLGPSASYTVYFGELYGILMALQMVPIDHHRRSQLEDWNDHEADNRDTIIFTDNQAAIRAVNNPGNSSGRYLLRRIIQELVLRSRRRIEIHWIPAHVGVEGNELADRLAKEATGWKADGSRGETASTPPDLQHLISAELCRMRARTIAQWTEKWRDPSTSGRAIRRLEPEPNPHILDKFAHLDRARSSMLVQARTMNIFLNSYLHRMQVEGVDSPDCRCQEGRENIDHVLLHCPRYADLREETLWGDGLRVSDLSQLLGDPTRVAMTTRFLSQTGRLPQFKAYAIRKGIIA